MLCAIWYKLVQYKKGEKHPCRGDTLKQNCRLKAATLVKVSFLDGCFSPFLNCTPFFITLIYIRR